MTGYLPMLRKELTEIIRTWRIWLLLIAFALFGVADPIIARFTKQIMASVAGGTTPVTIPDPTYLDAWAQWTKDLAQLLLVIVITLAAGSVAGEVSSGTLTLPLTKPLSRTAFVLAKLTAVGLAVTGAVAIGTVAACGATTVLFDGVDLAPVWRAAGAWLVLALLMIALTTVASCLLPSTIAAFGIGFGGYIVLTIVSMWQPARAYSPAGLPETVGLLARGEDTSAGWQITTAAGLALGCVLAAIAVFRRREL